MSFKYFPSAEIAAAILAGCTSFIEVHVWQPAYTYFLLQILVVLDTLLRNKLKKRPTRPAHLAVMLLAYTLVLAFAHGFGGHEIGLRWLPQVVLAPLVIFHLRRFIVNLSNVELMDNEVATLLNLKILKSAEAAEKEAAPAPAEEEEEAGSGCVLREDLAPVPTPAPAPENVSLEPV